MLNWLYDYSSNAIIAFFVVFFVASFLILNLLVRRIRCLCPQAEISDFAMKMIIPVFSMCGLLLAFSLVNVQNNLRHANQVVAAEAVKIREFDRLLDIYSTEEAMRVRDRLKKYLNSVVVDEWPQMVDGKSSDQTGAYLEDVLSEVDTMRTEQKGRRKQVSEIFKKSDEVADARTARIDSSQMALSEEYWRGLQLIVGILILLMALVDINVFRAAAMGLPMAALAILFAIVFLIDHPYWGKSSVSREPLIKVLHIIEAHPENSTPPAEAP